MIQKDLAWYFSEVVGKKKLFWAISMYIVVTSFAVGLFLKNTKLHGFFWDTMFDTLLNTFTSKLDMRFISII